MNVYVECRSCGHQWALSGGSFQINGCPKCKFSGVGRMIMGGAKPEWYKGPLPGEEKVK